MSSVELEIDGSDEPNLVWRVGFTPDPWTWTPWDHATDEGRFDGRWDDPQSEFRAIYTADSLLGSFLELLAHFRPNRELLTELDQIDDDDGSIGHHPEAPEGAVGYSWLNDRLYGSAHQSGRYCYITHSRSIAALCAHYPFERHGIALADVDAALLKDASDRELTRSIARWLYDFVGDDGTAVDGVRFNSRHGDEICLWAVFERAGDPERSPHIRPTNKLEKVSPDQPELAEVFRRFGLNWHEE